MFRLYQRFNVYVVTVPAGMQVKFVTLGYYNDDGTIQIISGDDKSSVSKVMVAVLVRTPSCFIHLLVQ